MSNKGAKPLIVFSLFVFVAFTFLILVYVGVKLKCEQLTKEKVLAQEELNARKNRKTSLVASEQYLSSEERIVSIAENELGMVKRTEPKLIITVNKDKIEQISKVIKEKYE